MSRSILDLVFILLNFFQFLLLLKGWKVLPSANVFVNVVNFIPHYLYVIIS